MTSFFWGCRAKKLLLDANFTFLELFRRLVFDAFRVFLMAFYSSFMLEDSSFAVLTLLFSRFGNLYRKRSSRVLPV